MMFAPYALYTPHFETELEIIQNHLNDGDEILFIGCNANFLTCDVNLKHETRICLRCMGKRRAGIKLLKYKINTKDIYLLTGKNKSELKNIKTEFNTLEELQNFVIEDFDIGYGVLSSLISILRNPEPDVLLYRNIIKQYIISSLATYRSMQNHIDSFHPDKVYIFNGRFAYQRATFRASLGKNIQTIVHERGCDIYHYEIFKNGTPHDIYYVAELIENKWQSCSDMKYREEKGSEFYHNNAKGIAKSWHSYVKNQKEGLLPKNWNTDKTNIVIFNSSDEEYQAIGDLWKNPIFTNQSEEIKRIVESVRGDRGIHIYLRVHPNLQKVKNRQLDEINSLKSDNLTIIPADSPISTYALLFNASKAITFGSTVGIEAAYWGIPSILAGPSYYKQLGSTYNPNSHEELMNMIYSNLEPKNKEGALKYGYFINTFGIKFIYFKPTGLFSGKFNDKIVKNSNIISLLAVMLRFSYPINILIDNYSISRNEKDLGFR